MLRAILDHIPPMLGCADFTAMANNYPWSRTDKGYMRNLKEVRLQGDDVLHRQISKKGDVLRFEGSADRCRAQPAVAGVRRSTVTAGQSAAPRRMCGDISPRSG